MVEATPRPDALILLMGLTGSGKTTFVNRASDSNLIVGETLESCTSTTQMSEPFLLDGRTIVLVDSPGFDDTNRGEGEILREITSFLKQTYEDKLPLISVLYLHRITDLRMGGVSRRSCNMFRELCGDNYMKNVVVVTNMWTRNPSDQIALQEVEREHSLATNAKFFQPAIAKGARMMRHDNTKLSAHSIIRSVLNMPPQTLQIQREMVDEHMALPDTRAGMLMLVDFEKSQKSYQQDIEELKAQHRREMEELRDNHKRMMENMQTWTQDPSTQRERHDVPTRLTLEEEARETEAAIQEAEQKLHRVRKQKSWISMVASRIEDWVATFMQGMMQKIAKFTLMLETKKLLSAQTRRKILGRME